MTMTNDEELDIAKKTLDADLKKRGDFLVSSYNERALNLVNNLATATTAFLALIFAFLGGVLESDIINGKEWLFALVVVALVFSLFAWVADYITSIRFLSRRKTANRISRQELAQVETLEDYNKVTKSLNESTKNSHSTDCYRRLQIVLFLIGVALASGLMVWCVFDLPVSAKNVENCPMYCEEERPHIPRKELRIIRNFI